METSLSPNFHDQEAIREWRELGFFYDYNEYNKLWLFIGSREGLLNFIRILREYSTGQSYAGLSDHLHIGPLSYLKLVTWNKPEITSEGIYGQQSDFSRLANIIRNKMNGLPETSSCFEVNREYSDGNEAAMRFVVIRDPAFDPSVFDASIKLAVE